MSKSDTQLRFAMNRFQNGHPVLIHDFDNREGETDLVYPAHAIEPGDIPQLRYIAGGLICVALANEQAEKFNLPYLHEEITHPAANHGDLSYDEHPSFSLSVNHRSTETGIPDRERAHTIQELAKAAQSPDEFKFSAEFRIPGHVQLLKAAPTLEDRQGHTELAITLAEAVNAPPAVVVCEMLEDGETALPKGEAELYATEQNIPFIEGEEIKRSLGKI